MNKVTKTYGQTTPECFFCGTHATIRNKEGIPCCRTCKDKTQQFNCSTCNDELEIKSGKFGTYFYCWKCGRNVSMYELKKFKQDERKIFNQNNYKIRKKQKIY